MKREVIISLETKVQEYLDASTKMHGGGETFMLDQILPVSEDTAIVICNKFPSNKKVMVLFFGINDGSSWIWLVPTDSHILGMQYPAVRQIKQEVEQHNFENNE